MAYYAIMQNHLPARLKSIDMLINPLAEAAVLLAQEMRKKQRLTPRRRGSTLRPGLETPLWNALRATTIPLLGKRGSKVLLARELAVDPSRITDFFVKKRAMPDAERTLELLCWLGRQRQAAQPAAK